MDFLNKAYTQLGDLFRSMTPGARITAGLLLAVVVVSLGYLFNTRVTGGDTYLLGGRSFSAGELVAIQGAFGKANLGGYEIEGARVRVPRGQQAAYMGALADAEALPMSFGDNWKQAITGSNPFESAQQQEKRLRIAKQEELGTWIRAMRGIEHAAVMIDEQQKGFTRERQGTASVTVKPLGSRQLEDHEVRAIRQMVAGAFSSLSAERVTVTDANTNQVWSGGTGAAGLLDDAYTTLKQTHEQRWTEKITNALRFVSGATISVNVQLDPQTALQQTVVKFDPKQTAAANRREQSKTVTSDGAVPSGRPGLEGQQGINQGAALASVAKGSHLEEKTNDIEEQLAISSDETKRSETGLTPKKVTVSVSVPRRYFTDVWRQQNPAQAGQPPQTPDPKQLAQIEQDAIGKIRQSVAALLPQPADVTDPLTLVTVQPFDDVPVAEIAGPGAAERATSWFGENWSTLGMIGLAGFSLVMLRSMVRSPAGAAAPLPALPASAAIAGAVDEPQAQEEQKATPKSRLRRRGVSGPSLRDELAEIVREDPDGAATILRSWIGNMS